jgi:hypothetical protein
MRPWLRYYAETVDDPKVSSFLWNETSVFNANGEKIIEASLAAADHIPNRTLI